MRALDPRTASGRLTGRITPGRELSDEALVARVAQRDADAFERLYRRYGREV
jgi:hypothetical protein